MILAGIDEAGYGPILGPLVVGCCAFEVDGGDVDDPPCLWSRLGRQVSRSRSKAGRKLHVNDSKAVYTPAAGLRELERSVLAITTAHAGWPADLDAVVSRVAADAVTDLSSHPWYAPADAEPFPLEQPADAVRVAANGLRAEMARVGVRTVHLAARVVPERAYNRMVAATRNKASVLFSTSALHLDHLLRAHGHAGLVIVCDRQGGREHYGPLLRLMFEEWSLTVVAEVDGRAEYHLRRGESVVRVHFRERAESACLPVAVASMLAKYLREALMRRLSAYWQARVPGLAGTAGYYTDGMRFLNDIAAARAAMGVCDADLIRSR